MAVRGRNAGLLACLLLAAGACGSSGSQTTKADDGGSADAGLDVAADVTTPTGLLIVQDQVPDFTTQGCTIPGTATTNRRTQGTLDVTVMDAHQSPFPYFFYPVVENLLKASTPAPGVVDRNIMQVESFHVTLAAPVGVTIPWDTSCPPEFDYARDTVTLKPGDTASFFVEIVRTCNTVAILNYLSHSSYSTAPDRIVITATVRAVGHFLDGTRIESPAFAFPVTACYGCLQRYPDATAKYDFPNLALCTDLSANQFTGNPCNPGQDQIILCCAASVDSRGYPIIECPGIPRGSAPADGGAPPDGGSPGDAGRGN